MRCDVELFRALTKQCPPVEWREMLRHFPVRNAPDEPDAQRAPTERCPPRGLVHGKSLHDCRIAHRGHEPVSTNFCCICDKRLHGCPSRFMGKGGPPKVWTRIEAMNRAPASWSACAPAPLCGADARTSVASAGESAPQRKAPPDRCSPKPGGQATGSWIVSTSNIGRASGP